MALDDIQHAEHFRKAFGPDKMGPEFVLIITTTTTRWMWWRLRTPIGQQSRLTGCESAVAGGAGEPAQQPRMRKDSISSAA
ncbi:unnamed protein product [Merluccius merluccius]